MVTHHWRPWWRVLLAAASRASTAAAGPGVCQPASASAAQHDADTCVWFGKMATHGDSVALHFANAAASASPLTSSRPHMAFCIAGFDSASRIPAQHSVEKPGKHVPCTAAGDRRTAANRGRMTIAGRIGAADALAGPPARAARRCNGFSVSTGSPVRKKPRLQSAPFLVDLPVTGPPAQGVAEEWAAERARNRDPLGRASAKVSL